MNLKVEYNNGIKSQNRNYRMSKAAFIKHLGIAGQGYAPTIKKLNRILGMFLHYSPFMKLHDFNKHHFSNPCPLFYDPTEKSHFSNLAGKAIADFLSKRIDKSIYTVNYEAVMKIKGIPIKGKRPDLIAFTSNKKTFAIESKGYSGSFGNMANHKKQSQTGNIPVDFSVACVSYDLYNEVKCKYYDPENETVKYDDNLVKLLTKKYYSGLKEFMKLANEENIKIYGENFYKIDLFDFLFNEYWGVPLYRFYRGYKCFKRVYLILPSKIGEYAENGISSNVEPFLFEQNEDKDDLYIDNDRIGILIEHW